MVKRIGYVLLEEVTFELRAAKVMLIRGGATRFSL